MSTEGAAGKPRAGKYCPRCRAMMPLREAVCGQCGHRFRSGMEVGDAAPETLAPETLAPDPVHRTMQFTLPPLAPRPAVEASTLAGAPDAGIPNEAGIPGWAAARLGGRRVYAAAALLLLALGVGAAWLWHSRPPAALAESSPAGVWETTLHGKAAANAHLEFALNPGGGGRFSWSESGTAAQSGQTPLRWQVNPDRTLSLSLTPPPSGDLVSQTLTGLFSRRPWPWRLDDHPKRLILGTLVLTEKH